MPHCCGASHASLAAGQSHFMCQVALSRSVCSGLGNLLVLLGQHTRHANAADDVPILLEGNASLHEYVTSREQGCASCSVLDVRSPLEQLRLAREKDGRLGLAHSDLRTY